MTVHTNSILSHQRLDKSKRKRMIIDVFMHSLSPLTDRQVKDRLGFSEMNAVRPRITELINEEVLREVGSTRDHLTGKTVRQCEYRKSEHQLQIQF